jgi:hypothetical protein
MNGYSDPAELEYLEAAEFEHASDEKCASSLAFLSRSAMILGDTHLFESINESSDLPFTLQTCKAFERFER